MRYIRPWTSVLQEEPIGGRPRETFADKLCFRPGFVVSTVICHPNPGRLAREILYPQFYIEKTDAALTRIGTHRPKESSDYMEHAPNIALRNVAA